MADDLLDVLPTILASLEQAPESRRAALLQLADFEQKLELLVFLRLPRFGVELRIVERRGCDRKREHASTKHRASKKSAEV